MSDRALKKRPAVSGHGGSPTPKSGGMQILKRPMIEDVMDEANKVAKVLKQKFKKPKRHCSLCQCTTLDRSCGHASDCCFGKACNMNDVDVEEENLKGENK